MVRAAVVALALVVPVGVAQANYYYGEGPYIGFTIGSTKYDIGVENWGGNAVISGSVDDDDVGVKFFWGYNLSENFGVELFYANYGETSFEGIADGSGDLWQGEGEFAAFGYTKNSGYGFAAIAKVPVGRYLDIFGKAGMYRWSTRLNGTDAAGSFSVSDSGSDMLFGGGAGFNITDRSSLRLEWERYIKIADVYDVDMLSLGFIHKF